MGRKVLFSPEKSQTNAARVLKNMYHKETHNG